MPLDLSTLPTDEIRAFCERHSVARMSIFGSALRDDFGPDSDIDVLVEFIPGRVPGLLALEGMRLELEALFGREVDLNTSGFLSRHIRSGVLHEAKTVYVAA